MTEVEMTNESLLVTQENFAKVETARMFRRLAKMPLNVVYHRREATKISQQNVIRMNRDTLYSRALIDLSEGATVHVPDAKGRYMTVAIINEDHYVYRVISEAGTYSLRSEEVGSTYALVIIRFFFDPRDANDLAEVHVLQDQLQIEAETAQPYEPLSYDTVSYKALHREATALGETIYDTVGMFGAKQDVDPLRHFVGAAVGWGGLPSNEAFYVFDAHSRKAVAHSIDLRGAPVDAFWSITIYNESGFLRENAENSYSLNSVTTDPTAPIYLADNNEAGYKNYLHIFDRWNYVLRFYRPRPEILDGTWQPPEMQQVS